MTLLKLIYRYMTNKSFRLYIGNIMMIVTNKNGIADRIDAELIDFRHTTLDMLSKRVDRMANLLEDIKTIPDGARFITPINDALNDLKTDYKDIKDMTDD